MNVKFVDMNVTIRLINVMEKLRITTLRRKQHTREDEKNKTC